MLGASDPKEETVVTFGEKLQEARKKAGYTQEQLAEKLCVSRSAVAKWESGNGLPDIENLKGISQLLDVSIDYLLDEEGRLDFSVTKEPIDLNAFEKTKNCRSQYDAVVTAKFPKAESIVPLIREKVLSKTERILEWTIMPVFGLFTAADQIDKGGADYLVEQDGKQYLVSVTKEFMTTAQLVKPVTEKKFVIGENRYKRFTYDLKK